MLLWEVYADIRLNAGEYTIDASMSIYTLDKQESPGIFLFSAIPSPQHTQHPIIIITSHTTCKFPSAARHLPLPSRPSWTTSPAPTRSCAGPLHPPPCPTTNTDPTNPTGGMPHAAMRGITLHPSTYRPPRPLRAPPRSYPAASPPAAAAVRARARFVRRA